MKWIQGMQGGYLGIEVYKKTFIGPCKHYLHWAIWIPRMISVLGLRESLAVVFDHAPNLVN